LRLRMLESCEPSPDSEFGIGREFSGRDLLTVVRLHAQNLDASIGADDGESVRRNLDDLTHLSPDSFRISRRHRLCLEYLQCVSRKRRPRARRRIAAADEIVNL